MVSPPYVEFCLRVPFLFRCSAPCPGCLLSCYSRALKFFQSSECGSIRLDMTSAFWSTIFFSTSLSDFCRLQVQCASCMFSMSDGCPPLDIGMMWSMHGASGLGYFSLKSTGFPQIPQTLCVWYIFFLFFSNAPRCVPYLPAPSFMSSLWCFFRGWLLQK